MNNGMDILAYELKMEEVNKFLARATGKEERFVAEMIKFGSEYTVKYCVKADSGDVLTGGFVIDLEGFEEDERGDRLLSNSLSSLTTLAQLTGMLPADREYNIARGMEDEMWGFTHCKASVFPPEDAILIDLSLDDEIVTGILSGELDAREYASPREECDIDNALIIGGSEVEDETEEVLFHFVMPSSTEEALNEIRRAGRYIFGLTA